MRPRTSTPNPLEQSGHSLLQAAGASGETSRHGCSARCRGAGTPAPRPAARARSLPTWPATLHNPRALHPDPNPTSAKCPKLQRRRPFPRMPQPGKEPDPHQSPPPARRQAERMGASLPARARKAGTTGSHTGSNASVFHPSPARFLRLVGIYLAFLSPRIRVRHWGGQEPRKGAEVVETGNGTNLAARGGSDRNGAGLTGWLQESRRGGVGARTQPRYYQLETQRLRGAK